MAERKQIFTTISGTQINRVYTPDDVRDIDYGKDIGEPGQPPYRRGIHKEGYRTKLWTMRQFTGFGTPEDTNERFKYLLANGQTGLSIAFDLPTLYGYDSDHKFSEGEVGKCGVSINSLYDMEKLLHGIPLDKVSTSMTINAPAAVIWAMYLAVAEKQGVSWEKLNGTLQNDILKEYIAQKEWICSPKPSMKFVVDTMEFGSKYVPKWNTISVSGYHIREAGSTALQELAFTLYDGIEYVKWALNRGLKVDDFAPRISFFFDVHNDFFEEIAKFRAARPLWYEIMTERFGAKDPKSAQLRFHSQTAGVSLTAQQPYNNIVRVAIQTLAGALGSTQSHHANSLDETLALPTENAARIALRTQQIIAHETGVTNTVDPLAGSYFIERLTQDFIIGCRSYFEKLDSLGGMVAAIEKGFPQREIQDASYDQQREFEAGDRTIVGVNDYILENETQIPILKIDDSVEKEQIVSLGKLRERRDNSAVQSSLEQLLSSAKIAENLMPSILNCVRNDATLGEICDVFRNHYGEYQEPKF